MSRRLFSIGGMLLLVAVVLATATPVQAQRRGGYRGGGWYGGGSYGGYRGGYWGGYPGYYGYRPYSGFGIGVYGPSYYGSYYGYPYGGYRTYGWTSGYTPGYYNMPYAETSSSYPGGYEESSEAATDTTCRLTIRAPENAEVWIADWKTPETGSVREFVSPPLKPGKEYTYDVRARWEENGRPMTQTQKVDVKAGATSEVSFPRPTPRPSR